MSDWKKIVEYELSILYPEMEYDLTKEIINIIEHIKELEENYNFDLNEALFCFKQFAQNNNLLAIYDDDSEFEKYDRELYVHKRNPAVLKDKKGNIFFLNSIVWEDVDTNQKYCGEVEGYTSTQKIKEFPFLPKTFIVQVKNGKILDCETLKKAAEYYKFEIKKKTQK